MYIEKHIKSDIELWKTVPFTENNDWVSVTVFWLREWQESF